MNGKVKPHSMSQPDLNVVDEVVTLLSNNWNGGSGPPNNLLIDKSDDIGKGRDLAVYDYVELSLTSPTNINYADLTMSSQDVDAAVYCELKSDEEDRRDAIRDEFRSIIEDHRKRPDTPGDYDRVVFGDITHLDDQIFGQYVVEITLLFEARSRSVVEHRHIYYPVACSG